MELNEYQKQAMSTRMHTCDNVMYMLLNLVGEVGEFSGKLAKHIRNGELQVVCNELDWCDPGAENMSEEDFMRYVQLLKAEAGDILWQLAGLCSAMGWPLDSVAKANLEKLASRQKRGVINGNGDER